MRVAAIAAFTHPRCVRRVSRTRRQRFLDADAKPTDSPDRRAICALYTFARRSD